MSASIKHPEVHTWIGGDPELGEGPSVHTLHDPNSGAELAAFAASSAEQVDRAVTAAHEAHEDGSWFRLGAEGRAAVLLEWATQLELRAEWIASLDALNSGVPITVTRLMSGAAAGVVRDATRLALEVGSPRMLGADDRTVELWRRPWGATGLILPWNAPAASAVKKLAFALAAGASVIMKPSSASPWSAEVIVQAAHEAGVPAGVVNVVAGGAPVGTQVVADQRIRAISMTGSTRTGRFIATMAAERFVRLNLELGSNNPAIVTADANLDDAAEAIVAGSVKLSGQWCEAPRRIIAAPSVIPELHDLIVEAYRAENIGPSLDEQTTVGPVAFEGRLRELRQQREELRAAGAKVTAVGDVPDTGWFFEPTVASAERLPINGEIFGPMLTLESAATDAEALTIANSGLTGLAGYVFGQEEEHTRRLARSLVAGEIKINGTSVLDMAADSAQSFFGDSGLGGHGDADMLEFFTGVQVIGTDPEGLPL